MANIDSGAEKIASYFISSDPFFIGRNGSTEMEVLAYWYRQKSLNSNYFPQNLLKKLEQYSGVWPATSESITKWAEEYSESLKLLDGLAAGWYKPLAKEESDILDTFAPNAFRTPLRSLEPYYVPPENRWTWLLAGKDVAVVSSFADTIELQLKKGEAIWAPLLSETFLPSTTRWHTVRSYFPPLISGNDPTSWSSVGVDSWSSAVDHIVKGVLDTKATVAILGCGGLAMIAGARLRKKGVSVILLGGAVQVLFGIKGARWANHDIISKFWNVNWVWPLRSETPQNARSIEGACYWGA